MPTLTALQEKLFSIEGGGDSEMVTRLAEKQLVSSSFYCVVFSISLCCKLSSLPFILSLSLAVYAHAYGVYTPSPSIYYNRFSHFNFSGSV